MSQAHEIIRTNSTLEASEAAAQKTCVDRQEIDNWVSIYTFADGSKLRREFMPAACEESSYIKVVN